MKPADYLRYAFLVGITPEENKNLERTDREQAGANKDRAEQSYRNVQARLSDGVLLQTLYGDMVALDAVTGKRLWSQRTAGQSEVRDSRRETRQMVSHRWHHSMILDGCVYAMEGVPAGSWSYTHWPMGTLRTIHCFDLKTGRKQWVWSWPAALGDHQQVVAIDPASGKERWRKTVDGRIDTSPTIQHGLVYVGTRNGWVYALNRDSGELAWRFFTAPRRDRMVAFGQLESRWPLHGSVLVDDDGVWAIAGRHNDTDAGIWWWRPETGLFQGYSPADPRAFGHPWGDGVGPVTHRDELYPKEMTQLGDELALPGRKMGRTGFSMCILVGEEL